MTVRNPSKSASAPSAPLSAGPKSRPRKKQTRDERAEETRAAIFSAAAQVVGKHGYGDASINRITEAAGIAQGTFYLYFESRQALFDELLPHVGQDMLIFIRNQVKGAANVLDMEERGFRAFFKFLQERPGFFRILNEAEIAAPVAYLAHFKLITQHYVEALSRGVQAGEIVNYREQELETLAYMFMAARSYLYLRYVKDAEAAGDAGATLPESVVETYMKLVRGGLT
ncbi:MULTISPECIES: TetR/AcrR family transcriptional regulator [Achromobacter]|uniref:TetR/AcrR family transcriptional regulator n=1 Tax=Alcaligenes xylosoxydans xylosoxydans TaxID=85698 RepID=A0A424WJV0_ALCXX|nr:MULTISPECIES: TetR/AcrR family transcriptional regulator [Achromobacter]MBC9904099.1 TetR/AcrR family transcriptional regulator [Achromobacter xylosoxidans]MBD0867942.1 TetR/AcrR family transcriptional regulator [Achromobacter xylosoxidans]QNP86602.1 TetR/AcrR family transcriptional regulator [Achromobacter xylosoxidans]RPJ93546.1 TetR/AcrR family transcriptional regulator [Achromobacter xylosoxidans]